MSEPNINASIPEESSFDFLSNLDDDDLISMNAPDPEEFLNVLNSDRCTIIFSLTRGNNVLSEKNFENVQIKLERHHEMAQMDMLNGPLIEMQGIWDILKSYGANMEKDVAEAEDTSEFTRLHITVIPEKYNGETVLMCINPMFWALTSYELNEPANIVRMMFYPEYVDVYQNEVVASDGEAPEITPDMDFVSMDTGTFSREEARTAYRNKYSQ